jgi:hypothetical protein
MLSEHKTARRGRIISTRYSRLEQQYRKIRSNSDLRAFPLFGDILTHRVFEDLIWDTPEDEELTVDFFSSKLSEHLSQNLDKWRSEKVKEVVEVVRKTNPSASISDLHLATTLFECTNCGNQMYYPQIFNHPCFNENRSPDSRSNERMTTCSHWKFPLSGYGLWGSGRLALGDPARINMILEACSLDPANATTQDLDSADPLIECHTCHSEPIRTFMRWPCAVSSPNAVSHPITKKRNLAIAS